MATPFVAGVAALITSKHAMELNSDASLNNNEDRKNRLLRMAAHPGYHRNDSA